MLLIFDFDNHKNLFNKKKYKSILKSVSMIS